VVAAEQDNKLDGLDGILETAVTTWVMTYAGARIEDHLESLLSASIEKEHAKTGFHSCHQVAMKYKDGPGDLRCDILFSPNEEGSSEPSTPLAMVEVGHNLEWWQKVDQNVK
jgi:hypothetical protein